MGDINGGRGRIAVETTGSRRPEIPWEQRTTGVPNGHGGGPECWPEAAVGWQTARRQWSSVDARVTRRGDEGETEQRTVQFICLCGGICP